MGFVLPAVNLGLGLLGGLFGRKRRKQLEGFQTKGLEGLQKAGTGFSEMGLEDLGLSGDYFKKLLSGDPQFMNEITGGRMSDISRSLNQQLGFAQRMGTRGGGTAAAIGEAPAQLQSNIRGLQLMGRMQGAQGLGEIGQASGQLGISALDRLVGGSSGALGEAQKQSGAFGEKLAGAFGGPIADRLGKWGIKF